MSEPQLFLFRFCSSSSFEYIYDCYYLTTFPDRFFLAVLLNLADLSVEFNRAVDIESFDFPRISIVQPVIGNFDLVAILDQLSENTIVISNTIAPSR